MSKQIPRSSLLEAFGNGGSSDRFCCRKRISQRTSLAMSKPPNHCSFVAPGRTNDFLPQGRELGCLFFVRA
jgi:hypothetical protein